MSHTTGDQAKTRAEKNPWDFELRRLVTLERAWKGWDSGSRWDKRERGKEVGCEVGLPEG